MDNSSLKTIIFVILGILLIPSVLIVKKIFWPKDSKLPPIEEPPPEEKLPKPQHRPTPRVSRPVILPSDRDPAPEATHLIGGGMGIGPLVTGDRRDAEALGRSVRLMTPVPRGDADTDVPSANEALKTTIILTGQAATVHQTALLVSPSPPPRDEKATVIPQTEDERWEALRLLRDSATTMRWVLLIIKWFDADNWNAVLCTLEAVAAYKEKAERQKPHPSQDTMVNAFELLSYCEAPLNGDGYLVDGTHRPVAIDQLEQMGVRTIRGRLPEVAEADLRSLVPPNERAREAEARDPDGSSGIASQKTRLELYRQAAQALPPERIPPQKK